MSAPELEMGDLRSDFGEIFDELASYEECRIEVGRLMGDRVQLCISIPPKYSVSKAIAA
jgi:putative transposase